MESNVKQESSLFTVKNVLRMLSLLVIIFVFCPSFLVSCSGQTVNVSVMTAVGGAKAYGETVSDPHPIMLICLILPIIMLVVLFLKKMLDNVTAMITLVSAAVDFVVWLFFRSSVKKFAEKNYCEFKTTGVYVFNSIVLILIILLTVMVVIKRLSLDQDLIQVFSGGGTQNALNQMTKAVNQMSSAVSQMAGNANNDINNRADIIGYCQNCGSGIPSDCKFCTSCGAPVPEELIIAAEEKRMTEEEAKRKAEEETINNTNEKIDEKVVFCQQCGAKLASDANFCESCGTKVE